MPRYLVCCSDPTISEQVRRTRLFAGFYIGEDPLAPNYDPVHKTLRSPCQTSSGPWLECTDVLRAHTLLMGGSRLDGHNYYGARATLKPVVPDLEPDWWKDDARQEYIMGLQVGLH